MPSRHIAVMLDPHRLDGPRRDTLRGIRRYADAQPDWSLHLDPHAPDTPDAPYHGILAVAYTRLAPSRRPIGVPVVSTSLASLRAEGISRVTPRVRSAGCLAAKHLLARRYLRYAFLGYNSDSFSYQLETGFSGRISRAASSASLLESRAKPSASARSMPTNISLRPPSTSLANSPDLSSRKSMSARTHAL